MHRKGYPDWARALASRFPLTPAGTALLLGAGGLLWWTYRVGHDHALRVVAWSCLALLLLSALMTWLLGGRQRKRIVRALSAAQLDCDEALPDAGRFLNIRYVHPPTDESRRVARRGHFREIRFRLHDPLELVSMACIERNVDLQVLPRRARPTASWQLPPEVAAGEEWSARGKPAGDMHEIGEYRRGDPLRFVLWKVSARRGSRHLYVRRPETVGDSKLAFYFMAGPGDDRTAELAYFMLIEEHIRSTDLLVFNTDDAAAVGEQVDGHLYRLTASGNAASTDPLGNLQAFFEEALRRRVSACMIFVPAGEAARQASKGPDAGIPTYFIAGIAADESTKVNRTDEDRLQFIPMEPAARL